MSIPDQQNQCDPFVQGYLHTSIDKSCGLCNLYHFTESEDKVVESQFDVNDLSVISGIS